MLVDEDVVFTAQGTWRILSTAETDALWQLSGDRRKAIHENMEYDLYYKNNMSFFLDLAILLETLIFAFRGI